MRKVAGPGDAMRSGEEGTTGPPGPYPSEHS